MEIKAPILSSTVYNVRYHLTDAKRYDEKTHALVAEHLRNATQASITSELNLKATVINTASWSTSDSSKPGVNVTFTRGVPRISSQGFEISAEVTGSWTWGATETESAEVGFVLTVTVPPMSTVQGSLMETRCSYEIPFSYTRRDVLENGSVIVYQKNDGIFTGNSGYDYTIEVVELPVE